MSTYLAYHCGKMNQSYKMTTENYESLYEANLAKFKLFGASIYEFVNAKTTEKTEHKVGKTVTVEQGIMNFNVATASYFKLDGVNVFEVLESKGYSFKIVLKLDIFHPEFTMIDKDNNVVATYKLNVTGPKQPDVKAIGNKQTNTQITTESDDLEGVFLGAFALSRVDFSANVM